MKGQIKSTLSRLEEEKKRLIEAIQEAEAERVAERNLADVGCPG